MPDALLARGLSAYFCDWKVHLGEPLTFSWDWAHDAVPWKRIRVLRAVMLDLTNGGPIRGNRVESHIEFWATRLALRNHVEPEAVGPILRNSVLVGS